MKHRRQSGTKFALSFLYIPILAGKLRFPGLFIFTVILYEDHEKNGLQDGKETPKRHQKNSEKSKQEFVVRHRHNKPTPAHKNSKETEP